MYTFELYENYLSLTFIIFFAFVAQTVKRLPTMQETWVQSLGWADPLEKEMAAHSSTLAWKIPWTEEPARLHTVHGVANSRTRLSDFHFHFINNSWGTKWRNLYLYLHTKNMSKTVSLYSNTLIFSSY